MPFCVGDDWICCFCFQSYATKFSALRHIEQKHRTRANDQTEPPQKCIRGHQVQRKSYHVSVDVPLFDITLQTDSPISFEPPEQTVSDLEKDDMGSQTASSCSNESCRKAKHFVKELCDVFCEEALRRNNMESDLVNDEEKNYSDADSDLNSGDSVSSSDGDQILRESSNSETSLEYISSDEEETKPLYEGSRLTYREHLLSIIAYGTKHNLNMSQTADLLELIELHSPPNCRTERSVNNLKVNVTGQISLIYHDMCEKCYRLFPEDASVFVCETEGCGG